MSYEQKYLKYKSKYLNLKQYGGSNVEVEQVYDDDNDVMYGIFTYLEFNFNNNNNTLTFIYIKKKKYTFNLSSEILDSVISDFIRNTTTDMQKKFIDLCRKAITKFRKMSGKELIITKLGHLIEKVNIYLRKII
jgi:hypothetical protein